MFEFYRNLQQSCSVSTFLWIIICVTVLTLFLQFILRSFRKDARLMKFAKQLPGPDPLPLIGNGLDFLYNMDGRMDMLRIYEEKYGPVYRLWFGKHLVVGVASLKDLEMIFSSSKVLNKPAFMDPAREFWGDNLFTSRSPLWRKSRKELQPLFVKNVLIDKIPLINNIIHKYVKIIERHAQNRFEFDIGEYFPQMAFNVLLEVVFNSSSMEYTVEDLTLLDKVMHEADCIFFGKMFKPWLQNPIVDYILYRKFKAHFKRQTSMFFQKILRNQMKTTKTSSESVNTGGSESKSTFIQLLYKIQDDSEIAGDDYVRAETINTMAAGTMTTSATLSFCVLMLAMHPEVQNKLYEELDHYYFEGTNRIADLDDLDNLPYLDQVLKETERRFTLVPTMFRNIEEDIKIGSYIFPAGTAILVPLSTIHMNPSYYENPDKFDPEHFSADSVDRRPKLAFMPFSTGARNCIGKALAELELKLTLIALVRLFEFRTSTKMNDIDLLPGISVTNRKGYWVSIRMRETNDKMAKN